MGMRLDAKIAAWGETECCNRVERIYCSREISRGKYFIPDIKYGIRLDVIRGDLEWRRKLGYLFHVTNFFFAKIYPTDKIFSNLYRL